MKIIGYGDPRSVRIRFQTRELDVLVDVLRDLRADATQQASTTYADAPGDERAIDDRHDQLRAIEALLIQLEEQRLDDSGRTPVTASTPVMAEVVRAGAREAIRRLGAAHDGYPGFDRDGAGDALIDAAETATAWLITLVSFDRVTNGPDQ